MTSEVVKRIDGKGRIGDKIPSEEEAAEVKKDIHMTGRAMRVGETLAEYKKEREESWERMNQVQVEKDGIELGRVRRELADSADQGSGDPSNPEGYYELPNVKICEAKLKALLEGHPDGTGISDSAKMAIYEMLTWRSEFAKKMQEVGNDMTKIMKNYGPQMEWYGKMRDAIAASVDSGGQFSWNSNPGWLGINTRPEAPKDKGVSIKVYATIPVTEYSFIQHIPKLAHELRKLSLESDDVINVKFPESLSGFVSHNDSVVIHFKKKENVAKISEILNAWMQANEIHEAPREMGRTKVAADSKDTSFSDLVAKNIADWLEQNAGKYDKTLLASEAVRHAIEQSQKSPI